LALYEYIFVGIRNNVEKNMKVQTFFKSPLPLVGIEGPGCPSGYDAGLTNQTSLVRFPSPLNFCEFHVILIRSLSGSELTIIWRSLVKWCYIAGKSVSGVAPAIVQLAHYVAYV